MGAADEAEAIEYQPQIVQELFDNTSHQYWNTAPMGMGNSSYIELNGSGNLNFTLELSAMFHEPLLWEQGYVNYSLVYENETVFSVELVNGIAQEYHHNMTNVSGNLTIQIQSSGSDSQTDDKPGDYYIASAYFLLKR
tara:strand:+ start:286 stop:699 length:414 start_codon:yes stop_codon:yes gene_type:complete